MIVKTTNYVKAEKFISDIVQRNGFGAIIADKGVGKTFIKRKVVGKMQENNNEYTVVEVTSIKENWRGITALMRAMIDDIAGESPRCDTEALRRQLRRILGDASCRTKVIIAIDEAQRLHHSTLRGIKNLHELGFGMRDKLFSIILFGQHSLKDKISDDELRPRIRRCVLGELTKAEKPKFVEEPELFEPGAFELFIRRTKNTPAVIMDDFSKLRDMAADFDCERITSEMVNAHYSFDARDIIKESGKSMRELSTAIKQVTGEDVSPTQLSQAANGKYPGDMDRLTNILHDYQTKSAKAV